MHKILGAYSTKIKHRCHNLTDYIASHIYDLKL